MISLLCTLWSLSHQAGAGEDAAACPAYVVLTPNLKVPWGATGGCPGRLQGGALGAPTYSSKGVQHVQCHYQCRVCSDKVCAPLMLRMDTPCLIFVWHMHLHAACMVQKECATMVCCNCPQFRLLLDLLMPHKHNFRPCLVGSSSMSHVLLYAYTRNFTYDI